MYESRRRRGPRRILEQKLLIGLYLLTTDHLLTSTVTLPMLCVVTIFGSHICISHIIHHRTPEQSIHLPSSPIAD